MYEILLEKHAERDIKKLTPDVFDRIVVSLKKLREDARPPACKKLAGWDDDWRVRVGDYRVLYQIDDSIRVVRVMRVRHRRDVYR